MSSLSPTLVRRYTGNQSQAFAAFQREAKSLAQQGYEPSSQSWAPGTWGCGAFLVALLLCFLLVGILVFIYMLVVKPAGTLTVTYTLQAPAVAAPSPASALLGRLAQLDAALAAGALTPEEHATRRQAIIDSV